MSEEVLLVPLVFMFGSMLHASGCCGCIQRHANTPHAVRPPCVLCRYGAPQWGSTLGA